MQKFVVAKKITKEDQSEVPPAKVKMSGYLKKKRNKVGGWRKMWFVLQNQLLLSYSSQEDYDKKLVSFKDVLNLVPGTIVRPCGGFRFTIETTTNVIYTFRCDDNKTCTDWITALVESLSMQGLCAKENGLGIPSKFHISLDNIRYMQPKKPVRSSYSWDSICRSKITKSPKLPIARNTARLLQRNGLSGTEANKQVQQQNEKARNFRLHEKSLPLNQSDEVCRINRMFKRSKNITEANSRVSCGYNGNVKDSVNIANNPKETGSGIGGDFPKKMIMIMDNNCDKDPICDNNFVLDGNCGGVGGGGDGGSNPRDFNQNRMVDGNFSLFEEQVQRLTLDEESGSDTISLTNRSTPDCKQLSNGGGGGFIGGMVVAGIKHKIESSTSPLSSSSSSSSPDTSYEAKVFSRLSASTDNVNKGEPIYAVVDLKHKYARRAKIREMEEQMEKERPKSIHVVTSDYEEVLNFSHNYLDKEEDENENIYEPINIPNGSHHRHVMWKYFPKISLEALIEMARHKKKEPKTEPQSPFSDIRKKLGNHRKSIKNRMRKFYAKDSSSNPCMVKERNAFSDDELDSQGATGSTSGASDNSIKSSCGNLEKPTASFVFSEIEKYRRGEKHIFGSLSRLKKTRTSLCLEDNNASKKKLLENGNKNDGFQQELRKEIIRRSGEKKRACHSKFYD